MKHTNLLPAFALVLLLSGCAKEPAQEYKLSAEQLAWQPYRTGDVLRFGHDKSSKVRTYRIIEVQDRMEKQYVGGAILPFPRKQAPLCQEILVRVQRTDSIGGPQLALIMQLSYESGYGLQLRTDVYWEPMTTGELPIDSINARQSIPTGYPSLALLPSLQLGPAAYTQVIDSRNPYPNPNPVGFKPINRLYYARGKGVVGFEENGSDLWYRLP